MNSVDKFKILCNYIDAIDKDNLESIDKLEHSLHDVFDPFDQALLSEEIAIQDTLFLLKRKINEINA